MKSFDLKSVINFLREADENLIIKYLYCTELGIILTQVLQLDKLTSILFALTFVIVAFLWLKVSMKKITGLNKLGIAVIVISAYGVLMNAVVTGTPLSVSYIKKAVIFSFSILFFVCADSITINEENKNMIKKTVPYLSCFLIVMYVLFRDTMFYYYKFASRYLTFHFSNPNLVSIFLICMAIYMFIHTLAEQDKRKKIFYAVLTLVLSWFVVRTRSRTSLLVLILFYVQLAVYYFAPRFKIFCWKIYSAAVAVLPLVFSLSYMAVIKSDFINTVFSFLVSIGKGLDSRVKMWTIALNGIKSSPWIGAYSQISNGTGRAQMHNVHLDIWASYGIIPLILMTVFLYMLLRNKVRRIKNIEEMVYFIAFTTVLLTGLGETTIFSGGLGVHFLAGMFLMLEGNRDNDPYFTLPDKISDKIPDILKYDRKKNSK